MKVAFVGKGGSGKTSIASLFSRYLTHKGYPVLAIDADINQHLAASLGKVDSHIPPLGNEMDKIKTYLMGDNPLITSHNEMIKTTPPGRGSRLLKLNESNPIFEYFMKTVDGVQVMAAGDFTDEDVGVKCYHSKTGAVELLLNHLVDNDDEFIIVDMTAGADAFASGLFTRFDATFIITEPTEKSTTVHEQYISRANEYGVETFAIGNKVADTEDIAYLNKTLSREPLAAFTHSRFLRTQERGQILPITDLEPENIQTLEIMEQTVKARQKNWDRYLSQAHEFHRLNAISWANSSVGKDLTKQIDRDFRYPD